MTALSITRKCPTIPIQNSYVNAGARTLCNIKFSKVLSLLLLTLGADGAKTALGKLQACAGKKIYIMDIGIFAKEAGVPACNLATVGFPGFRLKGKRALMIIQNHENAHESHSPPFPSFSSYTCS